MKKTQEIKCQHCHYVWTYTGKSKWYATCPRCRSNVRIKEDGKKTKSPKINNLGSIGRQGY